MSKKRNRNRASNATAKAKATVSEALAKLNGLPRASQGRHGSGEPTGSGPEPDRRRVATVPTSESSEQPEVSGETGGGLQASSMPQYAPDIYRAIEVGDRDTSTMLREEFSGQKSQTLKETIGYTIAISLAIGALVVTLVLYLHSDLKSDIRRDIDRLARTIDRELVRETEDTASKPRAAATDSTEAVGGN
jgi:hypothetical protein